MTTWTSKGPIAAAALMLLTACDGGQPALLFQRAMDALPTLPTKPKASALMQATMAEGAVILVPPKGYCIDETTLKPRFAIMGRCDVLGVANASTDAPLGLLAVSLSPAASGVVPTVGQLANAGDLNQLSNVKETGTSVTFQAKGTPPEKGYGERHWHGATLAGGYALGISLYGVEGSRALGEDGRDLLIGLIRRTRAETP